MQTRIGLRVCCPTASNQRFRLQNAKQPEVDSSQCNILCKITLNFTFHGLILRSHSAQVYCRCRSCVSLISRLHSPKNIHKIPEKSRFVVLQTQLKLQQVQFSFCRRAAVVCINYRLLSSIGQMVNGYNHFAWPLWTHKGFFFQGVRDKTNK